jgi:hypothetical protein
MRFMVMVRATKSSEAGVMPDAKLLQDMMDFNQQLVEAGIMQAGEGLQPSSKGARLKFSADNKRTLVDGPFAETKELVAGFWVWKCKSREEAMQWLQRCPSPFPGEACEVELRQVYEAEDFGAELTPELRAQEEALRARAAKAR